MKYKKTTLPSGVRVITVPIKGNPSATVMVAAAVGSDFETKSENGLSHFLEHMLFKGTPTRPSAMVVSSELDRIGAESNAFTSNEMTAYHAKGQTKYWPRLLDVVSDIYLHATIPPADLEKERGVILQEISMYEDLPQRQVWEVLGTLVYGDTPQGRTVLGPSENIKKFSQKDFLDYKKRHYVAENTLVIVAGDVKPAEVERHVKKIFKNISTTKKIKHVPLVEKQKTPALSIKQKKTDQTHMVMAFRSYDARDKRGVAASLLMSVLGAGMSSRLFQKMREEMGACYYIKTTTDEYTDHGLAAIYTGVEKHRVVEVVNALMAECGRLKTELVGAEELKKVKDFIVSHAYMGLETSDNVAGFMLQQEIVHGKLKTIEQVEREVRAVTAKDIKKVAKDIFQDKNLNLAIVGDVSDEAKIKKVLSFYS